MASAATPAGIDGPTRWLHAGLIALGFSAWLSGDLADEAAGFQIHAAFGLGLAAVIGARIAYGLFGPRAVRFSAWLPVTPARLRMVGEDLRTLLAFKLPMREPHQGIAGLVEACGLLLFFSMGMTGALLFAGMQPGVEPSGWLHGVEEVHELGEALIPVYLFVHVGAALAHALVGHKVIQRMFGFGEVQRADRTALHPGSKERGS